ncbi:MAG: endopeptidase La [Dorea sp.]|nr:endopeptidase La [Dorea sp.]
MITIPFYDMIVVPGIKLYFQNDFLSEVTGKTSKEGEKVIFLMLHDDKKREDMIAEDFYPIGVTGVFEGVDKMGNVAIRTISRMNIDHIEVTDEDIYVEATERPDIIDMDEEERKRRFHDMKKTLIRMIQGKQWGMMARNFMNHWRSMDEMICAISYQLDISNEEMYGVLQADTISERTARIEKIFYEFVEINKLTKEAQEDQDEIRKKLYREDAIKKQIEFLQKQLDEMHPENISEVRRFEQKIAEAGMNETARKEAEKILNRMKNEGQNSHEYGSLYDYLDFVTSLSWKKEAWRDIDLARAEEILNEDHYGLKKVKNRIIEQLAVMQLNQKQSGSILLFVGPPGTGKTSIGQSIAKALGREYVRISLGGVRDEAEIRGHSRTYVGAMPGRIMDGIRRSGVSNPVVVLDEVDKLVQDFSGDPSSALLEVLDPEQNHTFTDHYMNVPYDLSDVLFVCTANYEEDIPEPLYNRMEVIRFAGYTAVEKFHIAKKHLLPKAMESMGITTKSLKVSDDAIRTIISDYTMESGVRGLKKRMNTLCRVAAVKIVKAERKSLTVGPKKLPEFLDMKPITHDHILEEKKPGIVTGLAWTMYGGEILFIETMLVKGQGKIVVTGQLGDVMKESVQIALSLVKNMFPDKVQMLEENDLHIHIPAGATPKDGPSAGITMTTALASLLTGHAVSPEFAMTGEVSLRGGVMPIGGLPEKLMAAQRAGITKVFIPKENVRDLDEVADEVKEKLTIIPVTRVEEVLRKTKVLK